MVPVLPVRAAETCTTNVDCANHTCHHGAPHCEIHDGKNGHCNCHQAASQKRINISLHQISSTLACFHSQKQRNDLIPKYYQMTILVNIHLFFFIESKRTIMIIIPHKTSTQSSSKQIGLKLTLLYAIIVIYNIITTRMHL